MNIFDEIKESFREGNYLSKLIYINLGVYALVMILRIFFFFFQWEAGPLALTKILALPADPFVLLTRPWTLITSMFFHQDFFHILFNLLWLFWFGKMFVQFLDEKKLLSIYLLGGLMGGLFYMLSYSLFPVFADVRANAYAFGASAAVSAIVIGMAVYSPNLKIHLMFLGPVSLKYIGIVYVFLDLVQLPVSNSGGHIAHLGGAFWGYWYVAKLKKGTNIAAGFERFLSSLLTRFRWGRKLSVSYKSTTANSDYDYNYKKRVEQAEIDAILEKIQRSGYASLSADEKEKLFSYGNKKK